jgi:hypothetical protein
VENPPLPQKRLTMRKLKEVLRLPSALTRNDPFVLG